MSNGRQIRRQLEKNNAPPEEGMDISLGAKMAEPGQRGQVKQNKIRQVEDIVAMFMSMIHGEQTRDSVMQTLKSNPDPGKAVPMTMGCYGIGVSRVVAAAIEQNHDDRGIIWPAAIAPFQIALLPLNMHKSQRLREAVEKLYEDLQTAGFDVLLYDTRERPGVMFADMELSGIPHRLVFSEKGVDKGELEYKGRRDADNQYIPMEQILEFLKGQIQ